MQVVVSQAWTIDDGAHADAYVAKSEAMAEFLAAQPGFVSRLLLRGVEDRTHFTNVRIFRSIDDYTAITGHPDYAGLIESLSMHVDVERYAGGYPREFMDVVLQSGSLPAGC